MRDLLGCVRAVPYVVAYCCVPHDGRRILAVYETASPDHSALAAICGVGFDDKRSVSENVNRARRGLRERR